MSGLTPRELRQMAKQGDARAMFQLGQFYVENHDINEALKWYKAAAEEDIPEGMYMAAKCCSLLAIQPEQMKGTERQSRWKQAHDWYSMVLRCVQEGWTGAERIKLEEVLQEDAEAKYHLAAYDGVAGDRQENALRLLEGMDDRRSQVLRAVIEFDRCEKAGKLQDGLYHTFRKLAEDRTYAGLRKDTWEEMVYVIFVQDYALLCWHGVGQPGGKPNLKEALRILTEEKRRTTDPESLKLLEEQCQTIRGEIKKKRKYKTYMMLSALAAVLLLIYTLVLLGNGMLAILPLLGTIGLLLLTVHFWKKCKREQAELK